MSVKIDIIGGTARLSAQGWYMVRIANVTGLTSNGDVLLVEAALFPGMPVIGQPHPNIPFIYLDEIVPKYVDAGQAKVELHYRSPEGTAPDSAEEGGDATIEIGGVVQQVETYEDINGVLMKVPRDGEEDQVKPVTVMRPRQQMSFTFAIDYNPLILSEYYVGKVNKQGWKHDPGAPARTWLCMDISGRTKNNGATYTAIATFEKATDPPTGNFDITMAWIDDETRRPPEDVTEGNGQKTFQVYAEADFDSLPF